MTNANKSWPRWTVRHLEAVAELSRARLELELRSWRDVIEEPDRTGGDPDRVVRPGSIADHTELALYRASRIVPGATCIHRAVAGRRILARRGVDARVVIGLRGGDQLAGHAWLAIDDGDDTRTIFADDDVQFRPVR